LYFISIGKINHPLVNLMRYELVIDG